MRDVLRKDRPATSTDDSADREEVSGWFDRHAAEPLFRVANRHTGPRATQQVLLVLLAAFVAQILFVSIGLGLLAAAGITEDAAPVAFLSAQSAAGLLAFLAVGFGYLAWQRDPALIGMRRPTRHDIRTVLGGFVVFAGLLFGVEFLFGFLGIEVAENVVVEQGNEHPELFLVFLPLQFLLTGPAEELLFRGIVQGVLRRAYGVVPGIVFASALFALFHVPSLTGDSLLPVLFILFLSGAALGTLYEYSRTLLVPILVHALWNTLVFGTQYAQAVDALLAG